MAKATLTALLQDIQDKVRASSSEYRALESDKRAHFIVLDERLIVADVRKAVAKAMGRKYKDVPRNIKDKVTSGTRDMFTKYVDALNPREFASNTNVYHSTEYKVKGARGQRNLSVVFSVKPGKEGETRNVFSAFKSIKQAAQKEFVDELNTLLKGAGVREREISKDNKTKILQPIDKNDFLDIGHMGNSAVQTQRASEARDLLIGGYQDGNEVVQNYIKQLSGSLKFSLKRLKPKKKIGGQEVTEVGLEFSGGNRAVEDVPEALKNIEQELEAAIADVAVRFASDPASPSYIDDIEQHIENSFADMPGRKVGIKKKKRTRKAKRTSIKKDTKGAKGTSLSGTTKTAPVQAGKREQRKQSPINLMTLINSKLPQTVRKNMGFPALENRTGRFASSPRVVDVSQTAKGFPSVGYTYERQPYGVFEASSGSRFADPDRDPRTLIDKSIREIAAEMVSGRLFTRRV